MNSRVFVLCPGCRAPQQVQQKANQGKATPVGWTQPAPVGSSLLGLGTSGAPSPNARPGGPGLAAGGDLTALPLSSRAPVGRAVMARRPLLSTGQLLVGGRPEGLVHLQQGGRREGISGQRARSRVTEDQSGLCPSSPEPTLRRPSLQPLGWGGARNPGRGGRPGRQLGHRPGACVSGETREQGLSKSPETVNPRR